MPASGRRAVLARRRTPRAVTDLASASDSVADRSARTVAALVRTLSADRRTARLYVEARQLPALEARRVAAYDDFAELLMRHVVRADPSDIRDRLSALFIVSGTTDVISRWLAGDLHLAEDDLLHEIAAIGVSASARQGR